MPLFTIPKKQEIKEVKKEDNKILEPQIKSKNTLDLIPQNIPSAVLYCNKNEFFFLFKNNLKRHRYFQSTYLEINNLEDRRLGELYALKCLINYLNTMNISNVQIYSNLSSELLANYWEIDNTGSMHRYKAREIKELLTNNFIAIEFEPITEEMEELLKNESSI